LIKKSEFRRNLEDAISLQIKLPSLVKTNREVLAVGDVHGDLESVNLALELADELGIVKIVFIGDFVDRGSKQIETLNRLLELNIQEPNRIVLLRGNHEDLSVCSRYGFRERLVNHSMIDLWDQIGVLFSNLPIFLLKENYALYVHGGIPKTYPEKFDAASIKKGDSTIENGSHVYQALWNDPLETCHGVDVLGSNFESSPRGPGSYCYPKKGSCRSVGIV